MGAVWDLCSAPILQWFLAQTTLLWGSWYSITYKTFQWGISEERVQNEPLIAPLSIPPLLPHTHKYIHTHTHTHRPCFSSYLLICTVTSESVLSLYLLSPSTFSGSRGPIDSHSEIAFTSDHSAFNSVVTSLTEDLIFCLKKSPNLELFHWHHFFFVPMYLAHWGFRET